MPANAPPRAPGELAEIEAIIRRHVWARVNGDAAQILGFGAAAAEIAALRAPQGDGAETKEPPPGLLMSMALRYDHGIGAPVMIGDRERRSRELGCILTLMSQLWEEVAGQGFYRPEKEADYAAMADRIRPHPDTLTKAGGPSDA